MPLGLAALDDLGEAFAELRDVLDGTDAAAIELASRRVSRAAAAVRGIGAWRSEPIVIERLNALIPVLESARVRVSLLADHANQRLAILAAHGSTHAPLTYGR
ncbi:hypothetical protein [Sphingobium sp. Ant17]|uniref:hypothetical protein n=1 Tax=Sphingobium sp. Ant17 TaxID=1461752 RepID=UPI00044F92DA|nr:hypothetical protein [Sphingobium sp. Ant17]EXS70785.1 hypothetical protein BF95_17445 [Sphingobium sp. Ant17]OHC90611.1 MAG: hypothetical protein A2095_03300 [Sphingomonadales bacterium GWF1_63_6]